MQRSQDRRGYSGGGCSFFCVRQLVPSFASYDPHRIDPEITIQVAVSTVEDLQVLQAIGVNMVLVTAWTGIELYDQRPLELWAALCRIEMPNMFATLFPADQEILEKGDSSIFTELAAQGVDVPPTDLHLTAYKALSSAREVVGAFASCAGELAR